MFPPALNLPPSRPTALFNTTSVHYCDHTVSAMSPGGIKLSFRLVCYVSAGAENYLLVANETPLVDEALPFEPKWTMALYKREKSGRYVFTADDADKSTCMQVVGAEFVAEDIERRAIPAEPHLAAMQIRELDLIGEQIVAFVSAPSEADQFLHACTTLDAVKVELRPLGVHTFRKIVPGELESAPADSFVSTYLFSEEIERRPLRRAAFERLAERYAEQLEQQTLRGKLTVPMPADKTVQRMNRKCMFSGGDFRGTFRVRAICTHGARHLILAEPVWDSSAVSDVPRISLFFALKPGTTATLLPLSSRAREAAEKKLAAR